MSAHSIQSALDKTAERLNEEARKVLLGRRVDFKGHERPFPPGMGATVEERSKPNPAWVDADSIGHRPSGHIILFDRPRICIVGYGRHGKDEAALTLHGKGDLWFYGSTSWAALPEVARVLKKPEQIAWEQRHENRQFWKDYCDHLRREDPCYLIRKVLTRGNICSGIRDKVEIEQAIDEKLFDGILWIDRPGFPADPTVTFTRDLADDVIVNDGTLEEFRVKVLLWAYARGFLGHDEMS